jgi:hypothetical protein
MEFGARPVAGTAKPLKLAYENTGPDQGPPPADH